MLWCHNWCDRQELIDVVAYAAQTINWSILWYDAVVSNNCLMLKHHTIIS